MLNIQTFDNRSGGNVIYKALAHPLAAEAIAALYAGLTPPVALYDPDGIAEPLLALYPGLPGLEALFVHDVAAVGQRRAGLTARPLTRSAALPRAQRADRRVRRRHASPRASPTCCRRARRCTHWMRRGCPRRC